MPVLDDQRFHPWFARLVPRLRAGKGDYKVYSLKAESALMNSEKRVFVDVLLVDSEGSVHGVPFIFYDKGTTVFPRAAAALGERLTGIVRLVEDWAAAKASGELPVLDVFFSDPELEAAARDEGPDGPVIAGLATYARLSDVVDRYAFASNLAHARHVFDANPGTGYGTRLLENVAASMSVEPATEAESALMRRCRYVDPSKAQRGSFDAVFALNLAPERVSALEERAKGIAPLGFDVFSAREPGGAAALQRCGFPADPIPRLSTVQSQLPNEAFGQRTRAPSLPAVDAAAQTDLPRVPVTLAKRPLRILWPMRPTARTKFGGDVVHIRGMSEALERRGHHCDIVFDPQPRADGYDIVHFSNMQCPQETLPQVQACAYFPGPVVLSPIFADLADEYFWGAQAAHIAFSMGRNEAHLEQLLQALRARQLEFVVPGGSKVPPPPSRIEPWHGFGDQQRAILKLTDFMVTVAHTEAHLIYRHLDTSVPYAIAPYGLNYEIFRPSARQAFVERYGLEDFVVVAGRLEILKNQLLAVRALRDRPDRKLVFIGTTEFDNFGSTLREHWPENLTIFPFMNEQELAGAFAAARVALCPSWVESGSLVTLQAAACGAPTVVTRNTSVLEYLEADTEYCDPGDYRNIADAIDRAWESRDERAERRARLIERMRSEYTWDKSAEALERAYYELLESNPRGRRRVAERPAISAAR